MPVFTGNGVDPLINKLDTKKLDFAIDKKKYDSFKGEIHGVYDNKAIMSSNTKFDRSDSIRSNKSTSKNYVKISQVDKRVIDLYADLKQKLDIKKFNKLFVDVRECGGVIPEARESATFCQYRDSLYLFGGIGSQRFDYFNEYDLVQQRWNKHQPNNETYTELPMKRFGHSMVNYGDYFILFGGCGNFSEKTKMHESFNDVRVFDVRSKLWEKLEYSSLLGSYRMFEPEKRMFHVAATM